MGGLIPWLGRRWMPILLVLSLGVNLAVGGFVAARVTRGDGPAQVVGPLLVWHVSRQLPADLRADLQAQVREERPALRARMAEARAIRDRLMDSLAQDPPDLAAAQGHLAAIRAANMAIHVRLHDRLITTLADLEEAELRAVGAHLRDR